MLPHPESTRRNARQAAGFALLACALLVICWSTLRPHPSAHLLPTPSCCTLSDVVLNLLLFVPLGVALTLIGIRPTMALVVGASVSALIELAQYAWVAGRFASVGDVVANVAGCALGALLVARWNVRTRWWPVLAPLVAVSVVLAWFVGGHLAQPAIPGPAPWTVLRPPAAPGVVPFRGEIVDLRMQGLLLPEGRLADEPTLRALLAATDTTRLAATILTGPPAERAVRVAEVVVGEGSVPFLVLIQDGRDLVAYQRLGLAWVGLEGPWLRLKNAWPPGAGDTLQIRLEATRRHVRLAASHDGVERATSVTLSPELFLNALLQRATDGALWWRLVPAMLSFVLLGMTLANRPKLLVLASLAALFLSPNRGGCAYPEWPVVAFSVVGAVGGLRLGRILGLFKS